jgi:structural toxin protein (hemagglutinin/hemolysin) RtxA
MYKLIFYVPKDSSESVKQGIFETGAGCIGNYSHCSWETEGVGQFLPLVGSNAFIGTVNKLEKLPELRVEILCTKANIKQAVSALKQHHPYEEVAYEVVTIENYKIN